MAASCFRYVGLLVVALAWFAMSTAASAWLLAPPQATGQLAVMKQKSMATAMLPSLAHRLSFQRQQHLHLSTSSNNSKEHDNREKVETLYRESILSAQRAKEDAKVALEMAAAEAQAEERAAQAQVDAAAISAQNKAKIQADTDAQAMAEAQQKANEARARADQQDEIKRRAEREAQKALELANHEMDVALEKEGELAAQMKMDAQRKALEARKVATVQAAEEAERAASEAQAELEELIKARVQEEERRQELEAIRQFNREKAQDKLKQQQGESLT